MPRSVWEEIKCEGSSALPSKALAIQDSSEVLPHDAQGAMGEKMSMVIDTEMPNHTTKRHEQTKARGLS